MDDFLQVDRITRRFGGLLALDQAMDTLEADSAVRVIVVTGKDKGVTGKVIEAYTTRDKVLVEGVNRIKKHTKVGQNARGAKTGGIITTEAPIHVSNVSIVDGNGKPIKNLQIYVRQ